MKSRSENKIHLLRLGVYLFLKIKVTRVLCKVLWKTKSENFPECIMEWDKSISIANSTFLGKKYEIIFFKFVKNGFGSRNGLNKLIRFRKDFLIHVFSFSCKNKINVEKTCWKIIVIFILKGSVWSWTSWIHPMVARNFDYTFSHWYYLYKSGTCTMLETKILLKKKTMSRRPICRNG